METMLVRPEPSTAPCDGVPAVAFVLFHAHESDEIPRAATSFATEDEARAALARLRSSVSSCSQWAELARIASGTPTILAWFGRPSPRFTNDTLTAWLSGIDPATSRTSR